MVLDELVALLAFDVDDKNLKAFNDKIKEGITLVAGFSATIIGAGGALFAVAKLTADAGDAAAKAAQKYGISAKAYQELQYAARGDAEALTASLASLTKAQNLVIEGNDEQIASFQNLGISVQDVNGQLVPTDKILMNLAEKFQNMPDGPKKTAAAISVLGKSGAELVPFLNQGSEAIANMRKEANELGYVLGDDAIEDSQALQDNLDDLKNMFIGIRNMVGTGLIPIINKISGRIQEFVKVNRVLIATKLERFFGVLADYAERGWKILTFLIDAVQGLTEVFGGLENVIQLAAIAMSIFAGAKILFTIGSMIQLVQKLGTAFTIANAKALLIPILIGAAVVALGLIIEDIVAFFQGKDSVTGVIVEKFKAMFKYLEEGFSGLGGGMKAFITVLLTPLRMVINAFQTILELIDVIRGKTSVLDFAKNSGARLLSNFGIGGDGSLKGAMGLSALNKNPTASAAAGVSAAGSIASQNSSQKNDINMPITVQVGEGVDAFAVGKQVSSQSATSLDSVLRGTQRSFSGARSSQ